MRADTYNEQGNHANARLVELRPSTHRGSLSLDAATSLNRGDLSSSKRILKHNKFSYKRKTMRRLSASSFLLVLGMIGHHHRAGAFTPKSDNHLAQLERSSNAPVDSMKRYSCKSSSSTMQMTLHAQKGPEKATATASSSSSHSLDSSSAPQKKVGWRRRVFSRLRPNKRGHKHNMVATLESTEVSKQAPLDQFVLENFERLSPEQLFSAQEKQGYNRRRAHPSCLFSEVAPELPLVEASEQEDTVSEDSSREATFAMSSKTSLTEEKNTKALQKMAIVSNSVIGATSSFEGGPPMTKVVRQWFQNLLVNTFTNWSVEPPRNLRVLCSPMGNVFWSILRGQINCNVRMDFDRLVFEPIQLSGGSIEGSDLALNLLGFTVDHSKEFNITTGLLNSPSPSKVDASTKKRKDKTSLNKKKTEDKISKASQDVKLFSKDGKRYQKPFDLHANDCIMTQEDLFASECVRNGLRNLLVRILKRRNIVPSLVEVTSIEILDNGKVSCKGKALMKGTPGVKIPFEVRSRIGFKSRGHVLTFPGLEISLSPDVGFFVPVVPTIELDVGHNAKLREIQIDGSSKLVRIAASVTITPHHTLKVSENYHQSNGSYSARFSYDVGRWLTRIGRFSI